MPRSNRSELFRTEVSLAHLSIFWLTWIGLTHCSPRELALLRVEWWESESVSEHRSIEHFDSDVAVKQRGDDRNDEVNRVAQCLKIVAIAGRGNALTPN